MTTASTRTEPVFLLTPPTPQNVTAVAALLQANESGTGALTGKFPDEKVGGMLDQPSPVISAWEGDRLLGVLFTAEATAAAGVPVLAAMRQAWPGNASDYLYGPVCIAEEARGQGLLRKLYDNARLHLPGRAAVLFIADSNGVSRSAHERLGMHAVASFEWTDGLCLVYTDAAPIRTESLSQRDQPDTLTPTLLHLHQAIQGGC